MKSNKKKYKSCRVPEGEFCTKHGVVHKKSEGMKQQPKTLNEINEKLIVNSNKSAEYLYGLHDYEVAVREMLKRRIEELIKEDAYGDDTMILVDELKRFIGEGK